MDRFAADEVRAYEIRVRQSAPRGGWVTRCIAVAKPTQGDHPVTLNATIAGQFEPGTAYEVDYGHRGAGCGGSLIARSAVVEQTTAGTASFDIELVYVGTGVTSALRSAVDAAAQRWMRIVTGDIPNVDYSPQSGNALLARASRAQDRRGRRRRAHLRGGAGHRRIRRRRGHRSGVPHPRPGPCCRSCRWSRWTRPISAVWAPRSCKMSSCTNSGTPWVLTARSGKTTACSRIPRWAPGGIEINPGPDTHFNGALARTAFNAAGGSSYTGAKVPVENGAGRGSAPRQPLALLGVRQGTDGDRHLLRRGQSTQRGDRTGLRGHGLPGGCLAGPTPTRCPRFPAACQPAGVRANFVADSSSR